MCIRDRVRAGRAGPAARRDQRRQVRECAVADAGGFRKKSCDMVRERQAVKFAAIADWADLGTYPVVFMCAELEVSRSGYYAWRLGGPSARAVADQGFTVMIRAIYDPVSYTHLRAHETVLDLVCRLLL